MTQNVWGSQNPVQTGKGGTGLQTITLHGIMMGNGTGNVVPTGEMTNGQILIGKTNDFPTPGQLQPGAGIGISSGSGSITVSAWGGGLSWTLKGVGQALVSNNAFIVNSGAAIVFPLPTLSSVGDMCALTLDGATSWQITQGASQQIRIGAAETTLGAGGSIASAAQGDTIYIVCSVANTRWNVVHYIGTLTVV